MTTQLIAQPVWRLYDNVGALAVGGKVYTYQAGTTTPQATFTDQSGSTPNTNPIITNARGEWQMWMTPGLAYKIVANDAAGNLLWSVDNVVNADASGVSFIQAGSGSVARNAQDKMRETVSLKDKGAALDGATNDATALTNANATAASIGASLVFEGVCHTSSAVTITVPIVDTMARIFSDTAQVTIANGLPIRPEWFGTTNGALQRAIAALPSTGGVIQCAAADYNIIGKWALPTAPGNGVGNTKANVVIQCAGVPTYASDGSRFVSGSGTVFQGSFVNFADNFEIAGGFGVDCGPYVVTTLNGGNYLDGCVLGTHQLTGDGNDLTTYIKGVVHRGLVRVLMKAPVNGTTTTYKHGFLWEHIINGVHGDVEVRGGYHGYAHKSVNTRGGHVWVYEQGDGTGTLGDAYILKSDQYTLCDGLTLESLSMGRKESSVITPPGYVESTSPNYITNGISIGTLRGIKCGTLMAGIGAAVSKTNITIGRAIGDQITGAGLLPNANFIRFVVGSHTFTNTSDAGIWTLTGCQQVSLGDGSVTNSANDGYRLGGDVSHGKINSLNATGWGVNRSSETVLDVNNISGSGNTSGLISSAYLALTASDLQSSWVNNAGTDWPFQAELVGRTIHIRGVIKNGTASLVATLPVGLRPVLNIPFICGAVAVGGTRTFGHVTVGSNGQITIDNYSSLGGATAVVFFNDVIFLL